MSEAKHWVRNMYTGPGGGAYTGPGGGMYTGPDLNPYLAIHPPWPLFAIQLRKMRMVKEAEIIEKALNQIGLKI